LRPFVIKTPFPSAYDIRKALRVTREEVRDAERLVSNVLGASTRRAWARPVRRAARKIPLEKGSARRSIR
jgi:hypothetical protein